MLPKIYIYISSIKNVTNEKEKQNGKRTAT